MTSTVNVMADVKQISMESTALREAHDILITFHRWGLRVRGHGQGSGLWVRVRVSPNHLSYETDFNQINKGLGVRDRVRG